MKEWVISTETAGMRLDRYLKRRLPAAGTGFLERMLRKKNIVVNGSRARSNQRLEAGDRIRVYFSEETIRHFSEDPTTDTRFKRLSTLPYRHIRILYEDEQILALDKPAGVLSQADESGSPSLNEELLAFLIQERALSASEMSFFTPSVANRLDRNTSGIVLAGKTLSGQQFLSDCLAGRKCLKLYTARTEGDVRPLLAHLPALELSMLSAEERKLFSLLDDPKDADGSGGFHLISGWLVKDERTNRVTILEAPEEGADRVSAALRLAETGADDAGTIRSSLVTLWLLTGKSHQLRAQMAYLGHPIVGDPKYGIPAAGLPPEGAQKPVEPSGHAGGICDEKTLWTAQAAVRDPKLKGALRGRQLLHASRVLLPKGIDIRSPLPADF